MQRKSGATPKPEIKRSVSKDPHVNNVKSDIIVGAAKSCHNNLTLVSFKSVNK